MEKTVLIVDDEPHIQDLLRMNLKKNGYRTLCASSGEEALALAAKHLPDLIVLDVMMPGLDGLETCRLLRENRRLRQIPVIMLTAKSEESDKVIGLGVGADDYITKPFGLRELFARINAVLRRTAERRDEDDILRAGNIGINTGTHQAFCGAVPVELTLTEYNILLLLVRREGQVVTREEISALGDGMGIMESGAINVHMLNLRRKVGEDQIQTVRGVGYRLVT